MPVRLRELVDPATTAVLVMEMKRVTVGGLHAMGLVPGSPEAEPAPACGCADRTAAPLAEENLVAQ